MKETFIRIKEKDLDRHMYVIGSTGTGKTTFLKNLILDRIQAGEGIGLVDPHGDLTRSLIDAIPGNRQSDVILFNPTGRNCPVRINILEYDQNYPEQRSFIFNEMMKILNNTYNMREVAGPAFELYLRTFMLLVMKTTRGTLIDVVKAFHDSEFRDELLAACPDPEIIQQIKNFLKSSGDHSFYNFIGYITRFLHRFTHDEFIAPIISEPVSNINFRSIMDNQKILLVQLSKGKIGDEGLKFLGTVILNRIIMAAYSREDLQEMNRMPFNLFIDETQNFISSDLSTAMAEARKYKLRMILANQNLEQLDSNTLSNIIGNAGNLIAFRTGVKDSFFMEKYFQPEFTAQDLIQLPDYNCVARLMIDSIPSRPFSFSTTIC